jgi:amidohydrolase
MHASLLIEKGVLNDPPVDAALGIHLMTSLPTGQIGITSGPVMAGMHAFKLAISGKGGHTDLPQDSIDPILTAASIIQGVQAIQTREIDVFKPTLIVFGKISGGTIFNVIPDKVEMEGTIRHLYDDNTDPQTQPLQRFERLVKNICDAHQAEYDIELIYSHPAVINDPIMADFVSAIAENVFTSKENIIPFITMVGEDFCMFSNKVPSAFYFIGAGNKEKGIDYPHHHACFNIDEDSLALGVEMHVRSALSILSSDKWN